MVPYFVGVPAIMYTNPSNYMAWLSKTFVMIGVWRQKAGRKQAGAIIDPCDMLSNLPAAKRCCWVGEGPR